MSAPSKIIVKPQSAGQRLDVFLTEKLKISRSQIQKMIGSGLALVNDKLPKKAGDRISALDVVSVKKKDKEKPKTAQQKKTTLKKLPKIKIIAETEDYLVVEKPVGLLTHSTMKQEPDSLAEILKQKYPEIKKVGDDLVRPGIAHRLDKDASGLLVVARTQPMFEILKEQFKKREVGKEYLALVHGQVAKDWDEINFPIARGKNSERMAAIPTTLRGEKTTAGKEALTEFWVEKRFINFTLLRIKIHTGRMHQIRAHFLAYNHPLVGDPLYFQKKRKKMWDEKLGRLFLHCTKLVFKDREGQTQTFELPLPSGLSDFLKLIK